MPNICRTKDACFHVMHFRICENCFCCYFSLLVSFVLFGYIMKFFKVKCFMEQCFPTVSYKWSWVSDNSLIFFQNMSILYCWYWGRFVLLLWVRLYDVIIVLIKEYLILCFYDPAAMSSTFINSMMETVTWNDASCVVSQVLLMCGSITSV